MGPENFALIRPMVQKLRHFFARTNAGHTDTHKRILPVPLQNFYLLHFMKNKKKRPVNVPKLKNTRDSRTQCGHSSFSCDPNGLGCAFKGLRPA